MTPYEAHERRIHARRDEVTYVGATVFTLVAFLVSASNGHVVSMVAAAGSVVIWLRLWAVARRDGA